MSVASKYDLDRESGSFDGRPHSWLRYYNGTILDPTPEQFGWPAGCLVIAPDDALQRYYWMSVNASPANHVEWAHRFRTWGFGHPAFERYRARTADVPIHTPGSQSYGLRLC